MRLLDRVAAAAGPTLVWSPRLGRVELPSAALISARAARAPLRYVLDDDVAALAMATALGDGAQLVECIDLIRIPAPEMWIEWSERGAMQALADLGLAEPQAARAAQVGLLVRADETGRRGDIALVWDDGADKGAAGPDLFPFLLEFDLDDAAFCRRLHDRDLVRAIEAPADAALTRLLAHVRFRLRPEWRAYLERATPSPAMREAALHHNLERAAGDFPLLAAFCLLLAARSALALAPVSQARLNAARARRNKPPLLDHVEVSAHLDAQSPASRGACASRAEARLHFVCGHLVRRGGAVHWRRAHLRGSARRGPIALRTVSVRASSPARVAI
ncbi:MAG: hypothetical protein JNJ73_14345 [Hyphomonadaceae bacterium]|nr:hypothetical protein [Hyphomonadaceae bacterium]